MVTSGVRTSFTEQVAVALGPLVGQAVRHTTERRSSRNLHREHTDQEHWGHHQLERKQLLAACQA